MGRCAWNLWEGGLVQFDKMVPSLIVHMVYFWWGAGLPTVSLQPAPTLKNILADVASNLEVFLSGAAEQVGLCLSMDHQLTSGSRCTSSALFETIGKMHEDKKCKPMAPPSSRRLYKKAAANALRRCRLKVPCCYLTLTPPQKLFSCVTHPRRFLY